MHDDVLVIPRTLPTPTQEYRAQRELMRMTAEPTAPQAYPSPIPIPIPVPIPLFRGSRALVYKQDPTVSEIGIRKVFLPRRPSTGPSDSRIVNGTPGIPPVTANLVGDFIQTPDTPEFDAVHTYAVVRQTLTMIQRALAGTAVPWQWNSTTNTDPIQVHPHHSQMMNAFYSRTGQRLAFGYFNRPGDPPTAPKIYTCRSFDIVSHETGHAVLDGLKPGWLMIGNPPQTGGLHESFGDLTAIFLALSQLDQVEAVIAQTRADLHNKTFIADLAEQFGLVLGRPNGLRNADNNLKLSEVGTEVHAISQVFTGAIYDILADIFAFERQPALRDDAIVLYEVSRYLFGLLLRSFLAAPASGATYADVANHMLVSTAVDGKPVEYRNFIRNHFTLREVIVSPTPLTADVEADMQFAPGVQDAPEAFQDRHTCCGTMQLEEYGDGEADLETELAQLRTSIKELTYTAHNGHSRKRR